MTHIRAHFQVVNHVVEWESEVRPSMGRSWASVPNARVQMHLETSEQTYSNAEGCSVVKAVLVKSNKLPTGNFVHLQVTDTGVQSCKTSK